MYLLSIFFFLIDYLSLPGSVSSVIEKESSYHAEPEGLLETICLLHFQWLDLGKLLEKVTLKVTQVLWSGRLGDGAWWRDSQPASVSEHLPLSSSSSVCLHHDRSLLHVCSCVCAAFTLPWNEISPDTGQQAVENQMRHPLGRTEEGDCGAAEATPHQRVHGGPGPVSRPLPAGSTSFIHPGGVSSSSQTLSLCGSLRGCPLAWPVLSWALLGSVVTLHWLIHSANACPGPAQCQSPGGSAGDGGGAAVPSLWGTGWMAPSSMVSAYAFLP